MNEKYNVYLISDSTGETLDRIFLSLKSQFANFEYEKKEFAFIRTEQQIDKIIKECDNLENAIILYTIVETKLAKYLANESEKFSVPCFAMCRAHENVCRNLTNRPKHLLCTQRGKEPPCTHVAPGLSHRLVP